MTIALAALLGESFLVTLALGFLGLLAIYLNWLNASGALIASLFGLVTYTLGGQTHLGGLPCLGALFVFFVVAQIATVFSRHKKAHETRGISNVLGNGLVGLLVLAAGSSIGFFAALSGALSDTLSSELGKFSKTKPVLITTLQPVWPGDDGGVTLVGLLFGLIGALLMGLFYYALTLNGYFSIVIMLSGFGGNLADSFFGATLQRAKWIDNTMTNVLGGIVSVLITLLLAGF